jgi:hypothetical protein
MEILVANKPAVPPRITDFLFEMEPERGRNAPWASTAGILWESRASAALGKNRIAGWKLAAFGKNPQGASRSAA